MFVKRVKRYEKNVYIYIYMAAAFLFVSKKLKRAGLHSGKVDAST